MQKIVMRGERMGAEVEYEQIHTIIKIKNVSYANGYLNIFVENNGSVAISVDGIDVLLDGQIRTQSIVSTTVDGENVSIWLPRETLIINLSVTSVPNRVKVVTHNGVSAYW
jgi:flagellar protein FlaF